MTSVEITDLIIYPVKSMRGIHVQSSVLEAEGLAGDRRFMVVRERSRFVTQRDMPRLALVETAIEANRIRLSMEGQGDILLPEEAVENDLIQTRVWGDDCETLGLGDEVSNWLTGAMRSDDRLDIVQMAPGYTRPQGKADELGADTHTRFADAAPYLVASEGSLLTLNAELLARDHEAVTMDRFRPNIVIRGLTPFDEHRLSGLASDHYMLEFCHPCQRCVVTTIDQDTAVKNPEWQPYRTLCDINPMPGNERAPAFGSNARLARGHNAVIRVGDPLTSTGSRA
jgi:uncharacterized protein YcbX